MQSNADNISGAKAASDALKKNEERLLNLQMDLMNGYVFVDMNGIVRDSNKVYQQMTGYTAEELSHLTYFDLTPAKWHDYEQNIVQDQILPNQHSKVYEKEYIKKNGTVFPVELRTFLLISEAGEREGMWAVVRDISERKQAEEALRQSEEKFRRIVESSPTAMYFYHLEPGGRLILTGANPASDIIIGISHTSMLGKTIEEAFPSLADSDIPDIYRKVARNELGPQSFETGYADERFDGYYYVHVFRTGQDEIAVDFIDITARKQTEEALRHSEIEYRDTLDSLPDWIYVVDKDYKIVMVNAEMKKELIRQGLTPDCRGSDITQNFPFISQQAIREIELVFSTGVLNTGEQTLRLNGKNLYTEFTSAPIFKDDKVEKVILMIRDRSREKEMEEMKRRNAEQKEMLLREIHHRVKNNLAIVISLLDFQLKNNNNGTLARMIIDIQMRIRSMSLIHEHLYRSEDLDQIPLASYLESLAYMVATTFGAYRIKLVQDLDAMDSSIEIALPIGLIINELLTNAFKYAFPGQASGEIHLLLKKVEDKGYSIVVEDNGIGLPLTATMDSEKSLGLYIVGLLVEQISGTLEIVRNNGTSFHITFPEIQPRRRNEA